MEALRDRLSATPLSELLAEERASPEDEVVSLCHNDSVEQALKVGGGASCAEIHGGS
jgi:hypothetical protein